VFEPKSRYVSLAQCPLGFIDTQGRTILYIPRRFLPPGGKMPLLVEITVVAGDRLDTITARTLGDPEQFWRVCDANDAMNPFELTAESGRVLRVPVPQF